MFSLLFSALAASFASVSIASLVDDHYVQVVTDPGGNSLTIPAAVFGGSNITAAAAVPITNISTWGCTNLQVGHLQSALLKVRPTAQLLSDAIWSDPSTDSTTRAMLDYIFNGALALSPSYRQEVSNTFLAMAKGLTIDREAPDAQNPRTSSVRYVCVSAGSFQPGYIRAFWVTSTMLWKGATFSTFKHYSSQKDCSRGWDVSPMLATFELLMAEGSALMAGSNEVSKASIVDIMKTPPGDAVKNPRIYALAIMFYLSGCNQKIFGASHLQNYGSGRTLLSDSDAWNYTAPSIAPIDTKLDGNNTATPDYTTDDGNSLDGLKAS